MLVWRGAACLLLSKHRDPPWLLSSFRLRMSGNLQQQRAAVEQLRREANIKRISVSQAVEDIKVGRWPAGGGPNQTP